MAYRHEAPVFCDGDVRQWISWMDQYFDRTPLMEFGKITMAHQSLRGEAERYINELDSFRPFRNWKEMKHKLVLKFGVDDDPEKIRLRIESARGYRYSWNRDPWEDFVESRPQRQQRESPARQQQESSDRQNQFREILLQKAPPNVTIHPTASSEWLTSAHSSLMHQTADLNNRMSTVEQKLQSLDSKLENQLHAMDSKLDHLDSRFDEMMKMFGKKPLEQFSPEQPRFARSREQIYSPRQVHFSDHEQPETPPIGYRFGNLNLATRDGMLKKIQMPVFDGSKTLDWLADVEHFFELGHYHEEEKLDLVSLCVKGDAKNWFNWVMHRGGFGTWPRFKRILMIRFAKPINIARLDHELQLRNKTASSTVEQISVNDLGCPVTACFPPAVNPSESIPEIVQELDTKLKKDSCLENDDEAALSSAIVSTDNFAAAESELVPHLDINPTKSVAVQEMNSPTKEDTEDKFGDAESSWLQTSCFPDQNANKLQVNVIAVEEREEMPRFWSDIFLPVIVDETYEHSNDKTAENGKLSPSQTVISRSRGVHQLFALSHGYRRVPCKKKPRKNPKAWKFKFKQQAHLRKLKWLRQNKAGKFQVKHKWRFKQLHHASALACGLEQAAGLRTELQPSGFCHSGFFFSFPSV